MRSNEAARLEAVRAYADRSQEGSFDRIVTLASGLLSTPVALFSVVETDRIWFKARHGLQIDHVGREPGFCSDAILQDSPWTVEDANFADAKGNRLVKEFGLTSYAGVPLAVKSGYKIGTLCVMDHPSRRFRAQELEILESLAALVVDRLELCRSAREARDAATRNDKATLRTTKRLVNEGRLLASIVQSSQDAIVSKDLNGVVTSWNPAAEKIFGYSGTEMIGRSITRIIPTERLDEETRILESIKRGQRIEHFETLRRRKDGALVPISLTISPIKGDDDEVLGASKIARTFQLRWKATSVSAPC